MHVLQGGCHVPVAAYTQIEGDRFTICGRVLSLDGSQCVEHSLSSSNVSVEDAKRLGEELANILKGMGAVVLLELNKAWRRYEWSERLWGKRGMWMEVADFLTKKKDKQILEIYKKFFIVDKVKTMYIHNNNYSLAI
jgi:hypothetical protein